MNKRIPPKEYLISIILIFLGFVLLYLIFTVVINNILGGYTALIIASIGYLLLGIGLYGIIKSSIIFLFNLLIKIIKKLIITFLVGKSKVKKVYDIMTNKQDKILEKLDIIEKRLSTIEFLLNIKYSPEAFENDDVKYKKIVDSLKGLDKVSVSFIQRKFSIGYAKASKFMDRLEADKIVEPAEKGSSLRKVFKK